MNNSFLKRFLLLIIICLFQTKTLFSINVSKNMNKEINNINHSSNILKIKIDDSSSALFFKRNTDILDITILLKGYGGLFETKFLEKNNLNKSMPLSDYLLSLILMGSKSDITPEDFRLKLNEYRIEFDISSNSDDIYINIRSLKENMNKALEIILPSIFDTNFSQENIEIAKNSIVSNIKNILQSNSSLAKIFFQKKFFANSPYEPFLPSVETAEIINIDILKQYYNELINNKKEITLFVVGDFKDHQEILNNNLKNFLKKLSGLNKPKDEQFTKDQFKLNFSGAKEYSNDSKDNAQNIIYFVHPSIPISHKDSLMLNMALDYLGGRGLESLLMKKLREEKGYTYGVSASLSNIDYANFILGYMATNSSNDKELIIDEIKNIISKFVQDGISEETLMNLKVKSKNNTSFGFKDNKSILSSLIFLEKNKLDIKYFDEFYNNIDKITKVEIDNFIKNFFDINKINFYIY